MGFLDNSGDIILDAVLTDTGRMRLAQGDGSFKIVKFALGDDEIDYTLYDKTNANGSAYYDLNILQSPVLEAFTNNAASMKSKLLSIRNDELLYLPVVKVNDIISPTVDSNDSSIKALTDIPNGGYIITADYTTSLATGWGVGSALLDARNDNGILRGTQPFNSNSSTVVFDQGLDTNDLTAARMNAGDVLMETQYLVEVDSRLINIATPEGQGNTLARPAYIDDDNVAGYYFTLNRYPGYFAPPNGNMNVTSFSVGPQDVESPAAQASTVIGNGATTGIFGTRFGINLRSTRDVASSTTLFTELGGTTALNYLSAGASVRFYYIDTTLRITGYYTGYRVDVPLRIIKKVT